MRVSSGPLETKVPSRLKGPSWSRGGRALAAFRGSQAALSPPSTAGCDTARRLPSDRGDNTAHPRLPDFPAFLRPSLPSSVLACLPPSVPPRGRGPAPRSALRPGRAGGGAGWRRPGRGRCYSTGAIGGYRGLSGAIGAGPLSQHGGHRGRTRLAGKRGARLSLSLRLVTGMGRELLPPAAEGWAELSRAGHSGNKPSKDLLSPAVRRLD